MQASHDYFSKHSTCVSHDAVSRELRHSVGYGGRAGGPFVQVGSRPTQQGNIQLMYRPGTLEKLEIFRDFYQKPIQIRFG